jgi:hypothetical protein
MHFVGRHLRAQAWLRGQQAEQRGPGEKGGLLRPLAQPSQQAQPWGVRDERVRT